MSISQNYKYIYHLADLHIKPSDENNHEELSKAIDQLVSQIDEPDISLTIITGDIFHSKVKITKQQIEFLIDQLKKITEKTRVVIIFGNHDIPPNGEDDDLKGYILKLFAETDLGKKVHLITDEKIRVLRNLVIVHTKYYSNKIKRLKREFKDKIKISLFHNEINGSLLNNQSDKISNYKIKKEDFKDYDLVLLGHIHKHQYILPHIAYPGSLIQQTHGEDINNQGYIKWIINDKMITSHFVKLNQETGYVTLDLNNYKTIEYPIKSRIRFICRNDNELTDEIIEHIKSKTTIKTLAKIRQFDLNPESKMNDMRDEIKLKSNDDVIELINRQINIQEILNKEQILFALKSILEKIGFNYARIPKEINLNTLKFGNAMTYGISNVINFSKLNGIVGIVAPNFSGKSSIIDILLYSIYEESLRGAKKDILNVNKTTFTTYCSFDIKDTLTTQKYEISKCGKRNKNYITTNTELKINDEIKHISSKVELKDYPKIKICSIEDFILSSIIIQKGDGFLDLPPKEKRDIIFSLYNLEVFDDIMKKIHRIKIDNKAIINDRTKRRNLFLEKNKDALTINIESINEKAESKNKRISELKNEYDNIKIDILQYDKNNEYVEVNAKPITEEKYKINIERIKKIQKEIEEIKKRIEDITNNLNDMVIHFETKEQKVNDNLIPVLKLKGKNYKAFGQIMEQVKLYYEYVIIKSKHNYLKKLCETYNKDNMKEEIKKLSNQTRKININHEDIKNIQTYIDKVIIDYNNEIDDKLKQTEILNENKKKVNEINNRKEENKMLHISKNKLIEEEKLLMREQYIFENKQYITNKNKLNELEQRIRKLSDIIKEIENRKQQYQILKQLDKDIKEKEEDMDIILSLENLLSNQTELSTIIKDKLIKNLEDEVNSLLLNLTNFTIKINYDMKQGIFIQRVLNTSTYVNAEQLSGFEKEAINIIFKIVLNKLNPIFRTNFLIIDEGFTSYDKEHLNNLKPIIDLLKENYKFILMISHIDNLKEHFDTTLTIERENHESTITYE